MNFAKFLRIPFLTEHLRWLLLSFLRFKDTHNFQHSFYQNENISFTPTKYIYLKRKINVLSNCVTHKKQKGKALEKKIIEHLRQKFKKVQGREVCYENCIIRIFTICFLKKVFLS